MYFFMYFPCKVTATKLDATTIIPDELNFAREKARAFIFFKLPSEIAKRIGRKTRLMKTVELLKRSGGKSFVVSP